jgi:hypothetical protein
MARWRYCSARPQYGAWQCIGELAMLGDHLAIREDVLHASSCGVQSAAVGGRSARTTAGKRATTVSSMITTSAA